MIPCPFPLSALLPHAAPMILIDDVVAHDHTQLVAAVTVHPGRLFHTPDRGMPAHLAIEWMAQACGACIGARALATGMPIKIGLLLGTRKFAASEPWFVDGQRLHVRVTESYNDANMAVFDCTVTDADKDHPLATAKLTVYQPDDVATLLKGAASGA